MNDPKREMPTIDFPPKINVLGTEPPPQIKVEKEVDPVAEKQEEAVPSESHATTIPETPTPESVRTPIGTFTKINTSPAPEVHTPVPEASHTPTLTPETTGIAFTNMSTPPPEETIAPEVPPQNTAPEAQALARTGWRDKLKGLVGR